MSKAWHYLNIDSLANSGCFGLEYYTFGDFEKAKRLLMEGIQFCDMIEKGNVVLTTQEVRDSSYLDAWEDMQILIGRNGQYELSVIVEEAASVKKDLIRMLETNGICSISKIRNMERFFNNASGPYLSIARSLLRSSKKL